MSDGQSPAGDPVSRETPPVPTSAQGVFGVRLPRAEAFAALLATEGVLRGVIGPRETPRLWERHLLNCAVVGEVLPESAAVADVGSGAGLPGVVLAIARPDLRLTLVEPLQRRTAFLDDAVRLLELENVRVVRARAEELHGREQFDVVTSRAVAPLGRLLSWSVPLVAPDGAVLAMKGSSAADEIRDSLQERRRLRRFRIGEPRVLEVGHSVVDPPTRLVQVEVAGPAS